MNMRTIENLARNSKFISLMIAGYVIYANSDITTDGIFHMDIMLSKTALFIVALCFLDIIGTAIFARYLRKRIVKETLMLMNLRLPEVNEPAL